MKVPSSFSEFRLELEKALKKTLLDKRFVAHVGYTDCEDSLISPLDEAWQEYLGELDRNKRAGIRRIDDEGVYEELVYGILHDSLMEMYYEFMNPWNHAPGFHCEKLEGKELSQEIEKALEELLR